MTKNKTYVVVKHVIAKSFTEAVTKEKKVDPIECYLSKDQPLQKEYLPSAIGFTVNNEEEDESDE